MPKFEEEYMDVLQNIEFALAKPYQDQPEMTDWETLTAINALIRTYTAEQRGRAAPELKLTPLERQSYDLALTMCELRLGRESLGKEDQVIDFSMTPLTVEEIINCLKRIRRSVQLWQKEGGRRGYYQFISQFLT